MPASRWDLVLAMGCNERINGWVTPAQQLVLLKKRLIHYQEHTREGIQDITIIHDHHGFMQRGTAKMSHCHMNTVVTNAW